MNKWNYKLNQIRTGKKYTVSTKIGGMRNVYRNASVDTNNKWTREETLPYGSIKYDLLGEVYAFMVEEEPQPAPDHQFQIGDMVENQEGKRGMISDSKHDNITVFWGENSTKYFDDQPEFASIKKINGSP